MKPRMALPLLILLSYLGVCNGAAAQTNCASIDNAGAYGQCIYGNYMQSQFGIYAENARRRWAAMSPREREIRIGINDLSRGLPRAINLNDPSDLAAVRSWAQRLRIASKTEEEILIDQIRANNQYWLIAQQTQQTFDLMDDMLAKCRTGQVPGC